ncbi:hypothetical protein IP84_16870 [beta proteobacterium AAP99]|nr:hypothetical protein IP84_16870 [beta proteobacterium AAP99]
MKAVMEAPKGWTVRVEPPKRTLEQNALLHARLTEISARREWCGQKWPIEAWKRLLIGAWSRATSRPAYMLPALDNQGVDVIYTSSAELSKEQMTELIEFIDAWEAEHEHA